MATEIKLPALKENVDSVEVDTVNVHEGDTVKKDQPLLVVLAEKASLEVPSPVSGRVAKLLVKSGDEIKVGQPFCVVEEGEVGKDGAKKAAPRAKEPERPPAARKDEEKEEPKSKERAAEGRAEPEPKEGEPEAKEEPKPKEGEAAAPPGREAAPSRIAKAGPPAA